MPQESPRSPGDTEPTAPGEGPESPDGDPGHPHSDPVIDPDE